ncbi:PQQ-binding-like beta-propeller repeat protein [Streptomyces sp. RFCAC02]|uniref:PQQ-binding-like beta-propeller repeat protein n=1 Tax=Streptomyces sp. RFCAC02 TaxID=2499143 RepID=UPI0010211A07|nr:PQQ-binding-like beta-propeller repeat protein [Streptomyces sp. RFCAC02]
MRLRYALVGVVAVGVLAACGGGGDSGDGGGGEKGDDGGAETSGGTSAGGDGKGGGDGGDTPADDDALGLPTTQLSVPPVYDTARGWEREIDGSVVTLPRAGAVGLFNTETGRGVLTVFDIATGERLWRTAPVEPVNPDAELQVLAPTVDGTDYVAFWSSGTAGAELIDRGEETVVIDIFAAGEAGDELAPLHHVEVPGAGEVTDGGSALMVELDESVVAVDLASGELATTEADSIAAPADCPEDACDDWFYPAVAGITAAGPLISEDSGYEGFFVPDAWTSYGVAPENVLAEGARAFRHQDGLIAARWEGKEDEGDETWAILRDDTGETVASATCPADGMTADDEEWRMSATGRYLVYGYLAFDLEEGTGHCFAPTDRTNPVLFGAVDDTGHAYGTATVESDSGYEYVPVRLDIATGEVEETTGDVLPFLDVEGYGVFPDDQSGMLVVYAPAGE